MPRIRVDSVMPVMLICELPASLDDVSDDVTGRSAVVAASVVTSPCERPRNVVRPIDLRRRRKIPERKRLPTDRTASTSTEHPVDFAVCVPPIFGSISVTDMVEFIEV